jgi:hypothetical protein
MKNNKTNKNFEKEVKTETLEKNELLFSFLSSIRLDL